MIFEDDGDRRLWGLAGKDFDCYVDYTSATATVGVFWHSASWFDPALTSVTRHHSSFGLPDTLPPQSLNHFPISELSFIGSHNVSEGWVGNDPERVNYIVIHNQSHHQMFNLSHRTPIPALPSDVRPYRSWRERRARYGNSFVRRSWRTSFGVK